MMWLAYPIKEQIQITDMYSLFEVHYDNGYAFPGESHNFWECVYMIKGEACVSGNERVYNLAQGSIIFHKPLELHKFIVNGKDGADMLIFSFAAEGPLTSYLEEKVFTLSDFQKSILDSLLQFIRKQTKPTADSEGLHCSCLEPFHTIPTYSQMLSTSAADALPCRDRNHILCLLRPGRGHLPPGHQLPEQQYPQTALRPRACPVLQCQRVRTETDFR